jgi:hypothetical protein
MHHVLKDPDSNRLKGLFIACPESIQYLQSHHDVLLIDNTYSTNRFNMPLMDIIGWFVFILTIQGLLITIGVDHNNRSFFIAFAFLPDQSEGSYTWPLAQIRTIFKLIHPIIGLIPGSISTDCDQALRNAISTVFPDSATLLCLWHANKNIQQHCKGKLLLNISCHFSIAK